MPKLPRFTLSHDKGSDDWKLKDQVGRTVKSFDTKGDATAGGVLKKQSAQMVVRYVSIKKEVDFRRSAPSLAQPTRKNHPADVGRH